MTIVSRISTNLRRCSKAQCATCFLFAVLITYVVLRHSGLFNPGVIGRERIKNAAINGTKLYYNERGLSGVVANSTSSVFDKKGRNPASRLSVTPRSMYMTELDLLGLGDTEISYPLVEHSDDASLYPDPLDPWNDRIVRQLSYVPRTKPTTIKRIYAPPMEIPNIPAGRDFFFDSKCKVTECFVTKDISEALTADLVLLHEDKPPEVAAFSILARHPHRADQIWAFFMRESTAQARNIYDGLPFNWTISYAPSSTITNTYGDLLYQITPGVSTLPQTRDNAKGKTGKVLWFASNCGPDYTPNRRMDYVRELSKYIKVDIFGKCGIRQCTQYLRECMLDKLAKYKFYLSFENSNCDTYITEKYFLTALGCDLTQPIDRVLANPM